MKEGKSRGSSSILTPSLKVRRSSRTEPQQFLIFNPSSASAQSSLHPDTTRHTGGLKPTDWLTDWPGIEFYQPADVVAPPVNILPGTSQTIIISSQSANHLFENIFQLRGRQSSPHTDPAWSVEIWFIWFSLEYCKMSDVEAVCQTWRPRQDSAGMLINS